MDELMDLRDKRFGYVNRTEYMPRDVIVEKVSEMPFEQEMLVVKNNDTNIDALDGKDMRLMTGGMTVWYMLETLALTDTCTRILSDMRATRNYAEKASTPYILQLETEVKKQNYDMTIKDWMGLHNRLCRQVTFILGMDGSSLSTLVPACVLHEWISKSEQFNC